MKRRSLSSEPLVTDLQSVLTDINQIIPIINHWFHLLSAVIWIGGLAFLVMAVTPGLQSAVPKEYVKPIADAFYRRYKRVIGILMFVILFTGGINLHYVSQVMLSQTGTGISQNAKYLTVLFIKLSLVLGVVTIFLYTVIFKIESTGEETADEKAEQLREPIPFQRTALWMGLLIILCAAALKHLHF
jgi:putative copper export protein